MSVQEYATLRESEIRVLELLPATFDQPVHVLLHTVRLPTTAGAHLDTKDEYEALSYAWGDPTPTHQILIGEDCAFAVAESLFTLLRHLRLPTESRRLWIDAVCINQRDLSEKSVQVAQMGRIYTRAVRTVVWLGPSEGLDWVAFAMMDLELRCKTPKKSPRLRWFWDHLLEYRHRCQCCPARSFSSEEDRMAAAWQGLRSLYERSWFGRLWVIQEVVLARRSLVQSGHHVTDGHTFYMLTTRVAGDPEMLPKYLAQGGSFQTLDRAALVVTSMGRGQHLPRKGETVLDEGCNCAIEALSSFCGQSCGNPLDRVFALRNMTCANRWENLTPDYSLEAVDLFPRFVGQCLERCSGARWNGKLGRRENGSAFHPSWLLALAGSMKTIEQGARWPSWCPDLHNIEEPHTRHRNKWHGHIGHFESYRMECVRDTVGHLGIVVKGRSFAKVLEVVPDSQPLGSGILVAGRRPVEPSWGADQEDHDNVNLKWNLTMLQLTVAAKTDPAKGLAWAARCRGFLLDHGFARTERKVGSNHDVEWFAQTNNDLLHCLATSDDGDVSTSLDNTRLALMVDNAELLVAIQPERCLAALQIADLTYFGWVPENTKPGDEACVLYGAPFPFILRSLAGDHGYQLVGDCVIAGVDERLAIGPDAAKVETVRLV